MVPRAWTRLEHWIARGLAVVFVGIAVFLTVWGISEVRKHDRLDDVGVEVPAEIVRASVDDSGDTTTTALRVRFTQRGDARVVTEVTISYPGDFFEDHPEARRAGTRVEYDPTNPEVVRLADDSGDIGVELLIGAGVTWIAGITVGGLALRAWLRERPGRAKPRSETLPP